MGTATQLFEKSWREWTSEQLADYIRRVKTTDLEAFGGMCHWIGCEETRLSHCHFCSQHQLLAMANTP